MKITAQCVEIWAYAFRSYVLGGDNQSKIILGKAQYNNKLRHIEPVEASKYLPKLYTDYVK